MVLAVAVGVLAVGWQLSPQWLSLICALLLVLWRPSNVPALLLATVGCAVLIGFRAVPGTVGSVVVPLREGAERTLVTRRELEPGHLYLGPLEFSHGAAGRVRLEIKIGGDLSGVIDATRQGNGEQLITGRWGWWYGTGGEKVTVRLSRAEGFASGHELQLRFRRRPSRHRSRARNHGVVFYGLLLPLIIFWVVEVVRTIREQGDA